MTKEFYKMVFTASLLGAQQNRNSCGEQAGKLACCWASHLTGCLRFYVTDFM